MIKKPILNLCGFFFLLLGIAGAILPLLPATPFLLLAGYFFSKGSPRFHEWLLKNPYLGPPIKDWEKKGAIRRPNKILASVMLLVSALFVLPSSQIAFFVKVTYVAFASAVLTFIWSRPES